MSLIARPKHLGDGGCSSAYLGGGHVLEGHPTADQLAGHDAQAVNV